MKEENNLQGHIEEISFKMVLFPFTNHSKVCCIVELSISKND